MYTWLVLQMRFFNLEKYILQFRHVHFKMPMKSSQESLRMWCTGGATNAGRSFPRIIGPLLGENALFIVFVSNQMKEFLIVLFCLRWNWRIILTSSVPAVLTVVIRSVLLQGDPKRLSQMKMLLNHFKLGFHWFLGYFQASFTGRFTFQSHIVSK